MLDSARRTPQCAWIHAIGIESEHTVVEILRGMRLGSDPIEIANILSCLPDVVWGVCGAWPFVSRDDEADRRDVQASRIVRVGVPKGDAHEFPPFKFDCPREFVRDHERRVDLPRKPRFPKRLKNRRGRLRSHDSDHIWRCHEPCLRESVSNRVHAKEMVSIAMCRVDRRQGLSTCDDPVSQRLASVRFCSTVMNVSTNTASRSPEMSVEPARFRSGVGVFFIPHFEEFRWSGNVARRIGSWHVHVLRRKLRIVLHREHYAVMSISAHHASISFRGFFQRQFFNHRTHTGRFSEAQGVFRI
jgi:hypothetical protein